MTNIFSKLNAARKEFHSLKLKKSGQNKFAGYEYFELADFLIPALTVFEKHGLCAVISFDKDVATMTIYTSIGDNGSYSNITITSPMGSANLKGCHEVQNIGAVETYQRRYLWMAALEIVEHDALDASTGSEKISATKEAAKVAKKVIPEDRQQELQEMAIAAVNYWKQDNPDRMMELVREVEDNEEKIYFWDLLATEPAIRKYIKDNK